MWYEIVPCVAIMGTCLMLPQHIVYYINKSVFGNPMRRKLQEDWDCVMLERDSRLSGAVWKTAGLENIPDS
ncbi:NADH dehydrogenase [ubiquinone] 1 alpha subcomplex subunit 1-like [Andrena cerasifolii]|uniref:NADH dehydrogenase [ubiquinone] 1 alpha subcomplex subunit 1-like n=1 Tax=Andrena cerasifolii TaxID=2819439 RepID=UPI004037D696